MGLSFSLIFVNEYVQAHHISPTAANPMAREAIEAVIPKS